MAGIHVQKWTVSGDVHDCHLGVKWRPSIAVSIFISSLPLPVPSSWAKEKCRWWSAFSDFSESRLSWNSSSSKSLLLGLYSFQGPGTADYKVGKSKCPKWSDRRWLVLVETKKDFVEGVVRGEWYLDMEHGGWGHLGYRVQHKQHLVMWEGEMCVWAGALWSNRREKKTGLG